MNHPIIESIYSSYEARRENAHRPHMGGSQIGHHCDRFLWYQFRWADSETFEGKGRVLRLFDHGDVEESRVVDDLRSIGGKVLPINASTGKQWHFEAFGGHFAVNLDGVAKNLPDDPSWRLLEFKTANDKSFNKLLKEGVEKWNPQYYGQVQTGMKLAGLKKCLHITVNKNTDEMYAENIELDDTAADQLIDRAGRIIFAETPPPRCSENPAWYQCKFCPMWNICHGNRVAQVNMRTCAHSTATEDGRWYCERCQEYKTTEQQRQPCDHHLMRPDLVPYAKAVDAGDDWIKYESKNGFFFNSNRREPGHFTSQEMRDYAGILPMAGDDAGNLDKIRQAFDATLVGGGDK